MSVFTCLCVFVCDCTSACLSGGFLFLWFLWSTWSGCVSLSLTREDFLHPWDIVRWICCLENRDFRILGLLLVDYCYCLFLLMPSSKHQMTPTNPVYPWIKRASRSHWDWSLSQLINPALWILKKSTINKPFTREALLFKSPVCHMSRTWLGHWKKSSISFPFRWSCVTCARCVWQFPQGISKKTTGGQL